MPVLGLDVGTGGSRAIVVDEAGRVQGAAIAPHDPFTSPRTAWAEQHPEDWWIAAQSAIRQAVAAAGIPPREVTSVGLSGQMHGAVLLDAAGAVVRPAIIWCDQRTEEQCGWLNDVVGSERLLQYTLNPALTNFTLPKLLWVRTQEPGPWRRVRHLLLPKDYVRWQLSGEYATDVADASGTLMLDVARRQWSRDILAATGIDDALLPRVYESADMCARVSAAGARATGLAEGTPIVAGAGDQAAGAVGLGITRPGSVSVTIGTSGVVFAATDRPALDARGRLHTFCHAIPDRWHVMGVTQAAGLSLRWLRDLLDVRATDNADPYDVLTGDASTAPAGCDGVLWAPYLMGERTPHLDPAIRGALIGLAANHGRAHVVRAVLEGVAFSMRDSLAIVADLDIPVGRIRLGGGGARSALWRQIQADVYGHPVETVAANEGAAYGAAILAGVGVKLWSSVDEACELTVCGAIAASPNRRDVETMTAAYAAYRRLYPALRAAQARSESPVAL